MTGSTLFWDLPLWIKVHHILTLAASALAVWKLLPFFAGKIRVRLENRNRKIILDVLSRNGGMKIGELANALEMNYKTLHYHVAVLQKAGLVELDGQIVKVGV